MRISYRANYPEISVNTFPIEEIPIAPDLGSMFSVFTLVPFMNRTCAGFIPIVAFLCSTGKLPAHIKK